MKEEDLCALLRGALLRETSALRALVDVLAPVIRARVARTLLRAGRSRSRDLHQEVEDFTQEVFVALFEDGARALQSWDPARGLSLPNFVGLIAEHQAASILRSGKRSPWTEEPTLDRDIDRVVGATETVEQIHGRDLLAKLLVRLQAELSPRGLLLFQLLWVEEMAAPDISARMGMTVDAVYVSRSRVAKTVRRLATELSQLGRTDVLPVGASPLAEGCAAL